MYLYYTRNEIVIKILYSKALLSKESLYCNKLKINVDGCKNKTVTIHEDENKNKYFIYQKERIYLLDFDFIPYEKMIELLKNKKKHIELTEDMIWATFYKESSKIRVKMNFPIYKMIFEDFGLGIIGEDKMFTCGTPILEGYPSKEDWFYKIKFECMNKKLKLYLGTRTFYFSDFVLLLKQESIQLITSDEWENECNQKKQIYNKVNCFLKVKNFFKFN